MLGTFTQLQSDIKQKCDSAKHWERETVHYCCFSKYCGKRTIIGTLEITDNISSEFYSANKRWILPSYPMILTSFHTALDQ